MSASAMKSEVPADLTNVPEKKNDKSPKNYRGFVAGVFSGIAKLSGTWPSSCEQYRTRKLIHAHSGASV